MDFALVHINFIILATAAAAAALTVNPLPNHAERAESMESEIFHTKLQVSEHGIHFNETLSYDPANHLVTFHVPKHHNLAEHVTIMHNPSRKSLTLLTEHSRCQLKDIPADISPEDTFRTFAVLDSLHQQVEATDENSERTGFTDVDLGLASRAELAELPENMTKLCHGLPVHRVVSIEDVGENSLSEQLVPTHLHTEHVRRVKRQGGGICDLTYWIGRKSSDCPSCITCLYATCSLTDSAQHSNHDRCHALMNANKAFKHMLGLRSMVGALCCRGTTTPIGDVPSGEYLCACAQLEAAKNTSTTEYRRVFKECQDAGRNSYGAGAP